VLYMQIFTTSDVDILKQADTLLYEVLWEPFGLPRDTRSKFPIDGDEYVFVAFQKDQLVGAFVLIVQDRVAELRHAAVEIKHQGNGIGRSLCKFIIDFAGGHGINRIEVYGRNTAIGFWENLGFVDTSGWLDHDFFVNYGIRFKKMVLEVSI